MTTLLAVETSSEACSVALSVDEGISERIELAPRMHAELILPFVRSLLDEAGLDIGDLDAIAFGRGPGSFTSLRIGIGAVQGLAWGAELPVVPVSSLAAVAQQVVTREGVRIVVAMDARMSEIYTCTYETDESGLVRQLDQEVVCPPADLNLGNPGAYTGAGNGWLQYPELVSLAGQLDQMLPDVWPTASAVCQLAGDWLKQNNALPAAQAQPVYIRNQVAQKPPRI
jgi:tRNA threonylcarbamoyladenosine biosynthesis protein TsaB